MPGDANGVDAAILAVLKNDTTLLGYCPDGVFWDIPATAATRFVVVTLFDHQDVTGINDADLWERTIYLVKSVIQGTQGPSAQAAARIQTLLHRAALDLAGAGYTLMDCRRIERVRYTEIDPVVKETRWQHRGGQYEVMASPN